MSLEDQIQYHAQRAIRERDQGLGAASIMAARAHLELSSLHLAKLRDLQSAGDARMKPPMAMR